MTITFTQRLARGTLAMLFATFFVSGVWAQDRTISGTVTSLENDEALPGVNVIAKGTTIGTVTNIDGEYRLQIPEDQEVLQFSFIGYTTEEVAIGNQTTIDLALSPNIESLQEVIVRGPYSSVRESDLTSSIVRVEGERIQQQPIAGIDNLLQGNAPGVIVTNSNGRPGGSAFIRVRGIGSVNASNEPLFIIDGVQMTQQDYNAINPSDVDEITVLKDAAATSIYGARAANGVVLVTTKTGTSEELKVDYRFQYGVKEIIPLNFDLMNKDQKLGYEVDLGIRTPEDADSIRNSPANPETDWLDVLLRRGRVQQHNLSLGKQSDRSSFFTSLNYYDEQGIAEGSRFQRVTGRLNTTFEAADWLEIGNTLTIANTTDNQLRDRFNVQNPFFAALVYNPYEPEFVLDSSGDPVLDDDGDPVYNLTRQGFSISEAIRNNPEEERRTTAIGTVFAVAEPIEGLELATRIGGNYRIFRREYYITPGSVLDGYIGDPVAPGQKTDGGSDQFLYNWTNTINYNITIGGIHNVGVLLGTEFIKRDLRSYFVNSKGFPSRDFTTQDNASEVLDGDTQRSEWSLWSQFAEARYNYDERYLFTASLRRDGSSRFGVENKYGLFWSGSAAWNIAEESFAEDIEEINQLKLRASVGTSGNIPGINDLYSSLGLYNFGRYNNQSAAFPSQLSNPDVKWESTISYTLGLDFAFFRRVSGGIDYFSRTTTDLLFDRPVSRTVGFNDRLENIGEINNRGIEIEIDADVVKTDDFTVNVFGSIATLRNEVGNLDNGGEDIINAFSGVTLLREGLALNTYYLPRYAGVDPQTGDALYLTAEGEPTSDYSSDYAVALEGKSPLPTYFGNFGLEIDFRGLNLRTNFYYQGGNYVYNFAYQGYLLSDGANARGQQRVDAFNYWREPGDTDVLPRPDVTNNFNDSDRYLQKGDFIRMRNVRLGYSLPEAVTERIYMQNLEFFVQGTNLLTFTLNDFAGDPEVGQGSEESDLELLGEYTQFSYPNTRGFTAGVNITF